MIGGASQRERIASQFFIASWFVFALNLVSANLSAPFQLVMLAYAITRCDVRYLPSIAILSLDKMMFPILGGGIPWHISFGFSLKIGTYIPIVYAFTVFYHLFVKHSYDKKTLPMMFLAFITIIPAVVIALKARADQMSMWQNPLGSFLAFGGCFWAILLGRTWEEGKHFVITRLVIIFCLINILEFLHWFHIFTFAECPVMIALMFAVLKGRYTAGIRALAIVGVIFAMINTLFGNYFDEAMSESLEGAAGIGSTFTRFAAAIGTLIFAYLLSKKAIFKSTIYSIPYVALACATALVFYAVGRFKYSDLAALQMAAKTSFAARFEYKLVADRGSVWSRGFDRLFQSPLIFKRLRDFEVERYVFNPETGLMQYERTLEVPPHNQFLTTMAYDGWWLGLYICCFLWWSQMRAVRAAANNLDDCESVTILLGPFLPIFIAVGTTGQSLLGSGTLGNGLVTGLFPAILYGWAEWKKKK